MTDSSTPQEALTPHERAFLAGLDGDRGWRLSAPETETPPSPPPGRAGASAPAADTDTTGETPPAGNE